MHAVVCNQDQHWIFITQVEVYYKDKSLDDVAFTTKNDIFVDELEVKMTQQTNEGGGNWYELRITFGKFEAIATGGLVVLAVEMIQESSLFSAWVSLPP